MIISSPSDYREAAKRKLPRFLFDYIDGGANIEQTLQSNVSDLSRIRLRQRILKNIKDLSLKASLFNQELSMPIILAPVALSGMYARRGEVQLARAAKNSGIDLIQSTVSVCSVEEVSSALTEPPWFQLYVLKDRAFMKNMLQRAQRLGVTKLVFTVDMPTPGTRYRDAHSGMSGKFSAQRRILQACMKPAWALDVGLLGRPHDLGNISKYLGKKINLKDYIGWLAQNFDPSISWNDLEWIREFWKGSLIIKGILDSEDAKSAVKLGADGIVVSNHGGRQLDGVASSVKALPKIADTVGNDLTVLVDSGVRSGLDVVRMLALGAKGVLLGRSATYALATKGQCGVENLLNIYAQEMKVAMTLTGVTNVNQLSKKNLDI
ncbi:alpha-hydroxy-acid oxidizing enzyme [Francisella halioticida]|uniref:Alpha-hydroxy-acid oxidizing enzyme n=1 Tax=Francisella halioticida TaxID=549298 RepID=A0ABM6M171_9GAMM|nr:FMN-dependent L-lactate dehydrogenase LldD [Francisella halioticida]ASG68717.1 alpha-hydroxy-acid oxidizing enzyme [Francisella halioticida]